MTLPVRRKRMPAGAPPRAAAASPAPKAVHVITGAPKALLHSYGPDFHADGTLTIEYNNKKHTFKNMYDALDEIGGWETEELIRRRRFRTSNVKVRPKKSVIKKWDIK